MTNPEMLESQEAGWWDDIKEWLQNLYESVDKKISPYRKQNEKFSQLKDLIYNKSLEKTKNSQIIKWEKHSQLKYENKDWKNCIISTSKKWGWYPIKKRESISVKVWDNILTLNYSLETISEAINTRYYITDKSGNIVEDYLDVKRVEHILWYIQKKIDEYNQISDKKLAGLMK